MVRIALCSPLPPWPVPAAQAAARLLPGMRALGEVEVFVENPYQVQPGLVDDEQLFPIADLPFRLEEGAVDVPIYVLGGAEHHVHQLRYVHQHPGVLLLVDDLNGLEPSIRLQLRGLGDDLNLVGELGPELAADGNGRQPGLLAVLARLAAGVATLDERVAAEVRAAVGDDVEVTVLSPGEDAARELRDLAAAVHAKGLVPRPSPLQWPPVAAVVVAYNSRDIIAPCLQSLLDQDYPNLEILVVDNDSQDGTAQFVRDSFPGVRVIDSGANLGFADGNNLAFKSSDATYFVLLNQDAIARRNWVTEMVRVAELHPKIAAVGAKMLMDRCPTLLNSTGIEMNEAGWAWDRHVGEKDESPSPRPEEVFGGCGGALLLRRAALEDVGGFDAKFFMYFEDTDLCWRLLLAGYRNYYAPLATVRHDFHGDSGATPGREFRRRYMSERNRLQTLIKNCNWQRLKKVFPKIRKYEKGRLAWLDKQVRDNHDPEFHGAIARVIRRAWRWNLWRLPSLWLRRMRVQRLRRAPIQEVERLLVPGLNEGGHQGDVENFHDRFSATPVAEIEMGEADRGALGSGWHGVEQPPGSVAAYRWCKDRAWFYLQPGKGGARVAIKTASPIEPHAIKLFVEGREILAETVDKDVSELWAAIPEDLPRDQVLEFRIQSQTLRPVDRGLSPDIRELGVIVFGMRVG